MPNENQARQALEEAIARYSVADLASRWDVDGRTIEAWRSKSIKNPGLIVDATLTLLERPRHQELASCHRRELGGNVGSNGQRCCGGPGCRHRAHTHRCTGDLQHN